MKKILIINYRFHFTGGPERYMFNVIEELNSLGYEVITFSVKNKNNRDSTYSEFFAENICRSNEYLFEKYKKNLFFYFQYFSREFYSFYIRRRLKKLLKKTNPDLCYLLPHKTPLSVSVIDELHKMKIPIIHRVSDYNIICGQSGMYRNREFCNSCRTSKISMLKHNCVKNSSIMTSIRYLTTTFHEKIKIYNKIDHFVFTNEFAMQQFIDFGYKPERLSVIKTFSNEIANCPKTQIDQPIKLAYIGNVDDSKGIYDLIEAFSILNKRESEIGFTLNIYGGLRTEELEKVANMINDYKLENYIKLNGKIDATEIMTVYRKTDLTIIPARWVENLPNVLIESISNGTPVITPKFGSFSSVLNDDVAFFFQPYSINSLANLLINIQKTPIMIIEKSYKCYDFAIKNFEKSSHINKLINLFKKVSNENN